MGIQTPMKSGRMVSFHLQKAKAQSDKGKTKGMNKETDMIGRKKE